MQIAKAKYQPRGCLIADHIPLGVLQAGCAIGQLWPNCEHDDAWNWHKALTHLQLDLSTKDCLECRIDGRSELLGTSDLSLRARSLRASWALRAWSAGRYRFLQYDVIV
jgi:hypothetical protein